MNTETEVEQRAAKILEVLKAASRARTNDIQNIIRGLQRKEKNGELPLNQGWCFAAHAIKTALRMFSLGGFPCRSEFAYRMAAAQTERAEQWLRGLGKL